MNIRSIHTIRTAENTVLEIELAGLGNRVFAFMLDALMMMILMGLCLFAGGMLNARDPELAKTVIPVGMFLIVFGYHFFQEWLWNGKTVGKSILKIRVVRDDGQPIGIWESLGRNLLRLVDVYASGVGIFPILISHREKRFGDFLAGTIVVNNQKIHKPSIQRPTVPQESSLQGNQAGGRLTPEQYELLQAFLERSPHLFEDARNRLDRDFREYLAQQLHLDPEEAKKPAFFRNLFMAYQAEHRQDL